MPMKLLAFRVLEGFQSSHFHVLWRAISLVFATFRYCFFRHRVLALPGFWDASKMLSSKKARRSAPPSSLPDSALPTALA